MSIQDLEKFNGKRYINMVRCSNDSQVETSIPGQLDLMNGIAASAGLLHADDIILDGVSGSKPGNRSDVAELIERKRMRNDFEVLLVQTEDRFTRSGSDHGIWMKYELQRHGITVVYVSSDVPQGPYAPFVRMMKFEAAQETVKSTSLRSSQGYQRALETRNVATSTHSPFGTHRLYCSATNKPLFIIRDNGDGTQDKLDPESRSLLETYGTVGGNAQEHYRKQKSEKVYLVPGSADEVAVVRRLFQLRYVDGIGSRRIANKFNSEGIVAPEGGRWSARQVDVVAENEVYTGASVASRSASGRYFQRAKGSPQAVDLDPTIVATKKNLPIRWRPPEDWLYQDQPYLKEFLPEPLRGIAAERIRQIWTERCEPGRPKRVCNAHPDSQYILTGLLVAKHDGRKLKGYTSGPRGRKVRYYVHSLAQRDPDTAGVPNTTFRADALESAVLLAVVETLRSMPELKAEIEAAVSKVIAASQPPDETTMKDLKQRQAALSRKIMAILDVIDADAPEAKAKIAELQREQRQIEDKLQRQCDATREALPAPQQMVDSILARLLNLGESIGELPIFQLRQVLGSLIESITADLKTREVAIMLRVPAAAFQDIKASIEMLGLRQTSPPSIEAQTQHAQSLIFARINCEFARVAQKPCFKCRRRRAA